MCGTCPDSNKTDKVGLIADRSAAVLPRAARLPINRCNLPADILGGLTFQQYPTALTLDWTLALHRRLFDDLAQEPRVEERLLLFRRHMAASFQLDQPEEVGYDCDSAHPGRPRLDYLRLLRGWMFDSNGMQAAVLKGWVESRFGLLPRAHKEPLRDYRSDAYRAFCAARAAGLTNTNALETQLDLLFAFCQHELHRVADAAPTLTLYRGTNRLEDYECLDASDRKHPVLLLNNLNSFTLSPERAGEFGDLVFAAQVPRAKLLYFPGLLPGALRGEGEHLVIGGLYRVTPLRV